MSRVNRLSELRQDLNQLEANRELLAEKRPQDPILPLMDREIDLIRATLEEYENVF